MTYAETLQWLFAQLPMYQRVGGANYKIDLDKTHKLMQLLGHPEKNLASIHVAGTNGKGSTSHMLASILQEKGLKVGLYTSPHLIDFRERIKINGDLIDEATVVSFVAKHKNDFLNLELSFFEMTVGLAFSHFSQQKTDIAVIEVGMGGRLDSTNVITPLISVITNISLDHQQFLGDTLDKIAAEKGGIIKPNIPVVIGRTQPETTPVFKALAAKQNAPLTFADQLPKADLKSDLTGIYQQENLQTVWVTVQQLPDSFKPNHAELKRGLMHVVKNTGLMGRWQVMQKKPVVVCDTGHNYDGVLHVIKMIRQTPHQNLHMVWGMVGDKDVGEILKLLPTKASYYFTQPSIPRALPVERLKKKAEALGLQGESFLTVEGALVKALSHAQPSDLIFVGGSTFVVADALPHFDLK